MSNSNIVMIMYYQDSEDADEIDEIGESITIEDRIDDDQIKDILEDEDYSDDFQKDVDYLDYKLLPSITSRLGAATG